MPDENSASRDMRDLRRRAEARLRDQTPDVEALSAEEARDLVRELRTTQIELEIQNEELRRAQEELAAARDRYADLFEHAPFGYITLDSGGRIREANRTFADLVSRERGRLIGHPLSTLVADVDHPVLTAPCLKPGRREVGRSNHEVRMRREDRESFWAAIECVPWDRGGDPRVRCAVTDITGRKKTEGERERIEERLRQSQRLEAVGQLAGGIAHDFNNLLSVVLGYGEILLDKLHKEDSLRKYVEQILSAGRRSAALTRQILAFSRRQTLQPLALDLNEVVRSMELLLRRLIQEDIELMLDLSESLVPVEVDPGQIEQVIINLAVNARDAMPRGGRLTIETANCEPDDGRADRRKSRGPEGYVTLSVTDTGCGIDEATLPQIFEPFFTTKGRERGTGLGLSTVYGIVKQSGGDIQVQSEVGSGSTFRIHLPQSITALEVRSATPVSESPRGVGEDILAVEDDEAVRSLIEEVLTELGYRVRIAGNAKEALQLLGDGGLIPALVITDVIMPGMSGPSLVERLRREHPDIRVLFVSGYSHEVIAHHGVIAPGTPFIQKPFSIEDFAAKVREVLHDPSAPSRGEGEPGEF